MARDSSPFAKRLKGLAQRAGLPVDEAPPAARAPEPTPDDEQPTGEFPALTADAAAAPDVPATAVTPAPAPDAVDRAEQPTGEIPPLPVEQHEPPAAAEREPIALPDPEPAAEATPAQPSSPIWLDPPAFGDEPAREAATFEWPSSHPTPPPESIYAPDPTASAGPSGVTPPPPIDRPVAADAPAASAGPTLPPPIVPKREEPRWPAPAPQDTGDAATPTANPAIEPVVLPIGEPDAAASEPEPAPEPVAEPEPTADPTPEPVAEATPAPLPDDQPTLISPAMAPVAPRPVEPESTPEQEPEPATAESTPAEPEPAPAPALQSSPSLTGRIASLRRRIRPGAGAAPTPSAAADLPVPAPTPAATPAPEPAPEPAVALAEPSAVDPGVAVLAEPIPAKPSFAERASLRRRVKTLRARRDAGLLELGAIVLDQRRFGDPTAGALVRRRTDELADLDNEIAAIETVLDSDVPATAVAELGTVRCPSCSALVGPADRFCANCGTPRPSAGDPQGTPGS